MANVKAGDMAIVVRSGCGKNLGKIVRVERRAIDFEILSDLPWRAAGVSWIVTSSSKNIWAPASCVFTDIAMILDSSLRPVSGLPDTEDTDTKEPIKEAA